MRIFSFNAKQLCCPAAHRTIYSVEFLLLLYVLFDEADNILCIA